MMSFTRVLVLFLCYIQAGFTIDGNLTVLDDCVCNGGNVTFRCSVSGGLFTVWKGNLLASECQGSGITLRHYDFPFGNATMTCGNAKAVGISGGESSNVSELTLTAISEISNGRYIQCVVDDGEISVPVGNVTLNFSKDTASLPAPNDVRLFKANQGSLIFNWTSPFMHCLSLSYHLDANNCGICEANSDLTAICQNFTLPMVCSFQIHSVVCGNLTSENASKPVNIMIKVPDAPSIECRAHYLQKNAELIGLTTTFYLESEYNISNDLGDFTTTSYFINICDTAEVPLSACQDGVCSHYFNVSSSPCSFSVTDDITVSVFATNMFGSSPRSSKIIKGKNIFVRVDFHSDTRTLSCKFLEPFKDGQLSCFANIFYGESCQQYLGKFSGQVIEDTSAIVLKLEDDIVDYCYNITASTSNSNLSLSIKGFFTYRNARGSNTGLITGVTITALVVLVMTIICAAMLILCYRKKKTKESVDITLSEALPHNGVEDPQSLTGNTQDSDNSVVNMDDLNEVTHSCKLHDIEEDCFVIEYARRKFGNLNVQTGCGYFEFTKSEYIPPEAQIILMSEDSKFYTGSGARQLLGNYDDKVEVSPPDLDGTKWQKVFIQTKLDNKKLLKDTKFLHNCEVLEPFDLKFQVYDVHKDCTTLELGKKEIPGYNPSVGLGYYEFTQAEYISLKAKVMLMNQRGQLFTGNGARHFIKACEGEYRENERVSPPLLEGTPWKHVFIQTENYNRHLIEGTKFLYCGKHLEVVNDQFEMLDVPSDCNVMDFVRVHIPGYRAESGYGYHEFKNKMYLLPDTKLMLMDKDGKVYSGPGAHHAIGISDYSHEVEPPTLENWKHIFVQIKFSDTKLLEGSKFLYRYRPLRKVPSSMSTIVEVKGTEKCNLPDFIRKEAALQNFKPSLGYGYHQFTKPELISPNTEVVLKKKNGEFVTGPGARQFLGLGNDGKEIAPPNLSQTEYEKVFIQSRSYDQKLDPETEFLLLNSGDFEEITDYKLFDVEEDCSVVEFGSKIITPDYQVKSGYGFYEFVVPEYIAKNKRVILIDKENKMFTGIGARRFIGAVEEYDQLEKIKPPIMDATCEWKHVFIQSNSYNRKLKKGTKFLYCTTYLDQVDNTASVPEYHTINQDIEVINFLKHQLNLTRYSPEDGCGFYEFSQPEHVSKDKMVMLLDKKDKLFTGPGARHFIGAKHGYDDHKQIDPPNLIGTRWKCVFIQSKSYDRTLKSGTVFLFFRNEVSTM